MTAEPAWAEPHTLTGGERPELTDPGADVLPVVLQMAREAEAARELELQA